MKFQTIFLPLQCPKTNQWLGSWFFSWITHYLNLRSTSSQSLFFNQWLITQCCLFLYRWSGILFQHSWHSTPISQHWTYSTYSGSLRSCQGRFTSPSRRDSNARVDLILYIRKIVKKLSRLSWLISFLSLISLLSSLFFARWIDQNNLVSTLENSSKINPKPSILK